MRGRGRRRVRVGGVRRKGDSGGGREGERKYCGEDKRRKEELEEVNRECGQYEGMWEGEQ